MGESVSDLSLGIACLEGNLRDSKVGLDSQSLVACKVRRDLLWRRNVKCRVHDSIL